MHEVIEITGVASTLDRETSKSESLNGTSSRDCLYEIVCKGLITTPKEVGDCFAAGLYSSPDIK